MGIEIKGRKQVNMMHTAIIIHVWHKITREEDPVDGSPFSHIGKTIYETDQKTIKTQLTYLRKEAVD